VVMLEAQINTRSTSVAPAPRAEARYLRSTPASLLKQKTYRRRQKYSVRKWSVADRYRQLLKVRLAHRQLDQIGKVKVQTINVSPPPLAI